MLEFRSAPVTVAAHVMKWRFALFGLVALGGGFLHFEAAAQLGFSPTSSPNASTYPQAVITADVNGDGKLDLACATSQNNLVVVVTNKGNGTFVLCSSTIVGSAPVSIARGDINGDGKIDLITANSGSSTISALTNNGSGGFEVASTTAVGASPSSVTTLDANLDGKVDLATANYGAGTLTLFTNNGTGIFTKTITRTPGLNKGPNEVIAADVNADSLPDLVAANSGFFGSGETVSVLTNDGTGIFTLSTAISVGYTPVSLTSADFNNDGYLDVVCANFDADSLSVLTNDGSGGLALLQTVATADSPRCIRQADINRDGYKDLVCSHTFGNMISAFTNTGQSRFVLAAKTTVTNRPPSITAGDFNADGWIDVATANNLSANMTVFLNVPVLSIRKDNSNLSVSWPSTRTDWVLQQNAEVKATNWSFSSGIVDDGSNRSLTLNPSTNLFFRLFLQP